MSARRARANDVRFLRPLSLATALLGALSLTRCGGGSQSAAADDAGECADGAPCGDAADDASPSESAADVDPGLDVGGCPAERSCPSKCCEADERCALGADCAKVQPACATNDECAFDTYCLAGECTPYGLPSGHGNDTTCKLAVDIGKLEPAIQCRWTAPPTGDPHPNHVHVMSTPVVVDFDFDRDPKTLHPSIVFTTFPTAGSYGNPGVLRVARGSDCGQEFSLDDAADAVTSPAGVAVGDLDGDKRPEIVAVAHGGGLLAFRYDATAKKLVRAWRSGTCGAGGTRTPDTTGASRWSGPSIADLDDDGSPEIIYGAVVYGADGCIKSSTLGFPAYSQGVVPVVADVDEDGRAELILGNAIYEWNGATSAWVAETYFKGAALAQGQVAVADMGDFPVASLGGADYPEVVVISAGTARVQTIDGTVVFGPIAIPGGGTGGPPTIADFDGDGRREFATAGGGRYVVFDFDCLPTGSAAGCGGKTGTNGVLWSQASQDMSSNVTGSSVFDFDANGSAEAVYADECFLRIYEGATGKVLFSVARSSGTTYENPIIVDVDGDYRTEIVSAVNDYAGTLGCPATDPLFPAAAFGQNHGIVVIRDVLDRWAASRPVWNQHAYAVTNVGDRGEIPRTSAVERNWRNPKLNDFRQNVQGSLEALGVPDLTAGGAVGVVDCEGTVATLSARVCNRGTLPMVSGTEVSFYDGSATGPLLCTAPIPVALGVSECSVVQCTHDLGGKTIDLFVRVDPAEATRECWEKNNTAIYRGVVCGGQPF